MSLKNPLFMISCAGWRIACDKKPAHNVINDTEGCYHHGIKDIAIKRAWDSLLCDGTKESHTQKAYYHCKDGKDCLFSDLEDAWLFIAHYGIHQGPDSPDRC